MIKMITYMDMYLQNEQKDGQSILIVGRQYENLSHRETKLFNMLQSIDNNRRQKNRINEAISKFNLKPTNGLKEFQEMGIYKEGESQKLAEFILKNVKKFSKPILGDFLGDIDEFYANVLRDFTFLFNFEGENMANAMRRFFTFFDAPGEAQKIERIAYVFADKYIIDNPDVVDSESGGVFAFLMVMLHTNLYNPNVDAA
jgi:Sec7-like guanine-nucleotide exchange factor